MATSYAVAMQAAIFGLIGVIVGGLVTGGTQLWLEQRREKQAVSRARRLVSGELLNAILLLGSAANREDKTWTYFGNAAAVLPTTAWQEHRAHLAGVLSVELWERLVKEYVLLEIQRLRLQGEGGIKSIVMSDEMIAGLKQTVIDLRALRKDLDGGN